MPGIIPRTESQGRRSSMSLHRYRECINIITELHPFDDAVDWLTGLQSESYLKDILQQTRGLADAQARERARRGVYFAGAAVDFIEMARAAKPHSAFLPAYYAFLNMCKLVIACSDK